MFLLEALRGAEVLRDVGCHVARVRAADMLTYLKALSNTFEVSNMR